MIFYGLFVSDRLKSLRGTKQSHPVWLLFYLLFVVATVCKTALTIFGYLRDWFIGMATKSETSQSNPDYILLIRLIHTSQSWEKRLLDSLTFSRYKQFGIKLSRIFGFAKSSKYKTNFNLSLKPKLLVACVTRPYLFNVVLLDILLLSIYYKTYIFF